MFLENVNDNINIFIYSLCSYNFTNFYPYYTNYNCYSSDNNLKIPFPDEKIMIFFFTFLEIVRVP